QGKGHWFLTAALVLLRHHIRWIDIDDTLHLQRVSARETHSGSYRFEPDRSRKDIHHASHGCERADGLHGSALQGILWKWCGHALQRRHNVPLGGNPSLAVSKKFQKKRSLIN